VTHHQTVPRAEPVAAASPRKGAIRTSDIEKSTLAKLNRGEIESVTLVEVLAVHHGKLLRSIAPEASKAAHKAMDQVMEVKITERMKMAGRLLLSEFGLEDGLKRFARQRSDTARSWTAYMIGEAESLSLDHRLGRVAVLADDPNPGPREWAWLALRRHINEELGSAISLLTQWTEDGSANIRRFATESTRPRGVWCAHLQAMKQDPALGLPLLEPLHSDESKYVQDSVANWLNDASKSQPEFVRELCQEWLDRSQTKATARICHRAMRSLTPR
jgi:3-methyladenine DNA glycosylase AlkC